MSAKVKLISIISAFVLVLGIMIIGVLSAEQVKVNIGGSVSFNATNVYAKVSGNISGAQTGNKTFSTLTYSASETTGDESDWTNLALEFTETPDPIEITITVENLSTQRTLTVNLENTLSASGLNITVTRDSDSYTSAANVELPVSTGDGSSTTTFILTLTVANPDQSLTDATFGYILNLFDENYTPPPTPASSFAFSYSDANHTASITDFVGSETEVIIPSTVENNGIIYKVTSIGDAAFFNGSSLTSITIPSSVTSIGSNAFRNCSSLTSITIPEEVISIGREAFNNCRSLAMVNFEENNQLTSIGDFAFYYCENLTSITIPDTVTSIGDAAFNACYALVEVYNYSPRITVNLGETSYSNNGYLGHYAKVVYNASDLTGVKPKTRITVVSNMQYYEYGDDFIALAPSVSRGALTEVTLDSRTTEINQSAFDGCSSLTSITIPEGVTSIASYTFYDCSSLTSITIPSSVTSIGDSAFKACYALVEVYNYSPRITVNLGETSYSNNGYLGHYAKVVYNASDLTGVKPKTRITVVDNVQYYNYGDDFIVLAPTSRRVTEVALDSRTTEINQYAFSHCDSLTTVNFGDSSQLTSISFGAFQYCSSLTSITIPDTVTSIGDDAFQYCSSLTSVYFGENSQLTSIGDDAFWYCSSLTSITIPEGVTSIGSETFHGCSNLTSITINATTPPTLGIDALPSYVENIYVPKGSEDAYEEANGWSSYASKISAIQ